MARTARRLPGLLLTLLFTLTRAAAQAPPGPPAEPPEPAASPAVARLLAEADRLQQARQFARGLAQAKAALAAACSGNDRPGEAGAQRMRALCLGGLEQHGETRTAWEAAGRLWQELGDGPGQVEALRWRALLLPASPCRGCSTCAAPGSDDP